MLNERIYRVGDVARFCGVSDRVVARWLDEGKITSLNVPGSHRRVSYKSVMKFLEEKKLPIPLELKMPLSLVFFRQDEKWYCVKPDFITLQESIFGCGETFDDAYLSFLDNELTYKIKTGR